MSEPTSKKSPGGAMPTKQSPNYFVSVQITNPQIKARLEHVQKYVIAHSPEFSSTVVSIPKAHLTIMVLRLNDDDDITRAKIALDSCSEKLKQFVENPVKLPVTGLGDFHGKVVFAIVEEGDALCNLKHIAEVVRGSFAEQGLETTDSRPFNPHLTVMKMSDAPHLYKKGIKAIPEALYTRFRDVHFGVQTVLGLQLCAMNSAEAADGSDGLYYHVTHSVPLVSPDHKVDDSDARADAEFDFSLPDNSSSKNFRWM